MLILGCLSGRSKNKGKQAVQAVLVLETVLAHQRKEITKLETMLVNSESIDCSEISLQLEDACVHLASLEQGMRRKRAALGIDDQIDLRRLQQDAFLRIRINALALKERIRDRLRQRKFEIEKLERNYRHSTNGMCLAILVDFGLKLALC
jgi:hypothetical protein